MCAELTAIPAEHWRQHPRACEDLLEKKFRAFGVAAAFVLYAVTALVVLWAVIVRLCLLRPMVRDMQVRWRSPRRHLSSSSSDQRNDGT